LELVVYFCLTTRISFWKINESLELEWF